MKQDAPIVSIGSLVVSAFIFVILAGFPSAHAVTPSGNVNYFTVSGGSCTTTAWTTPVASDGNVPGMFPNNVGGPPMTVIVGAGQICIQVILSGGTANTNYVVTATKLSGTLTVTTDSSGNTICDSAHNFCKAVFTSSFSGQCVTDPLKMDPDAPFGLTSGQINHIWVGTGTSGSGGASCTSSHGVPEFPAGIGLLIALALPALFLLRKRTTLNP